MNLDPTLQNLLWHHVTKGIGLLVLVYVWYIFIKDTVIPWMKRENEPTEGNGPKTANNFPMVGLLLMVGISAGALYYATTEQAYRQTNRIHSEMAEKEAERIRKESAEFVAPEATPMPQEQTLDEKVKAAQDENRASNEAAKKAFLEAGKPKSSESSDNGG